MPQIIQRKLSELSENEKKQIKTLLKRYYPKATQEYINYRLSDSYDFDVVLLKSNGVVLGISYYKVDRLATPFYKDKIPVIHFGQALKNEYYKGGIIWKIGHWYAKRNISYLYPIKRIVGLSIICNPKVFEHFTKLFKNHCPNLRPFEVDKNVSITNFLQDVYEKRGMRPKFNIDHYFVKLNYEPIDITDDWERYYKTKDESINDFFIKNNIIKFDGNRIYDNNIGLIVCGYRNPCNLITKTGVQIQA